jgi:hypothetical protein
VSAGYDYDVAILSDLRYPGGNSSSIVEEVKAQAAAGYTTALVHVHAAHMGRRRSFHHRIIHTLSAGLAQLETTDRPLRVRALLIRQPRVFAEELLVWPSITADVVLLAVNQPPFDGQHPIEDPYYDVAAVRDRLADLFGTVTWAPIGPMVRESLARTGVEVPLRPLDWHNVLDVDEWAADRSRRAGDRPVIGRHSRGHPTKWPDAREDILAAYPDDPRVLVRILGGADPAIRILGRQPGNWTVLPFGSVDPARFLSDIDFFVYFHHPQWSEAFGRNCIEAMASGAPAILPPHFRELFGDAAIYTDPGGVREVVDELYADDEAYASRAVLGQEFVEHGCGFRTHVARLAELIGPPSGASAVPARPPRARTRVLCVSAEPFGAGSTTRLRRVAARLPPEVEPCFLLASPAFGALSREIDALCEHVRQDDAPGPAAEARLYDRTARTIARQSADAVMVDGREPPSGVMRAALEAEVPLVWMRPGEGGPERSSVGSGLGLALPDAALLQRRTAALAAERRVGAEDARARIRELVGPADGRGLALLALGADERLVVVPRAHLAAEVLLRRGCQVVVPEFVVADGTVRLPPGVIRAPLEPLCDYLAAFDVAVIHPGYTITQEVLGAALPSLALPLRRAGRVPGHAVGDRRRTAAAASRGLLLGVEPVDGGALDGAVQELLRPERAAELHARCAEEERADAAFDVARTVMELIERRAGRTAEAIGA